MCNEQATLFAGENKLSHNQVQLNTESFCKCEGAFSIVKKSVTNMIQNLKNDKWGENNQIDIQIFIVNKTFWSEPHQIINSTNNHVWHHRVFQESPSASAKRLLLGSRRGRSLQVFKSVNEGSIFRGVLSHCTRSMHTFQPPINGRVCRFQDIRQTSFSGHSCFSECCYLTVVITQLSTSDWRSLL